MSDLTPLEMTFGMTEEELLSFPTVYRNDLFKDKVVLVSGGGTGIGQGIAVLFARLGATIVLCSRKQENLDATRAILDKIGCPCDTYAMTIRDPEQVAEMMAAIWEKHGKLDILINNAGGQFPQDAIDYAPKGWNAVIDTNLTGSFYMMQGAARQWRDHEQPGSIVNILAVFQRGMPQIAHTSAARAGVANLCMSLGVEWAPFNIRVNAVAPGTVDTVGLKVYPEETRPGFRNNNPMRDLGTMMDVAESVVFLAGPSGRFITGATLSVDGGQVMWGEGWPLKKPDYFEPS